MARRVSEITAKKSRGKEVRVKNLRICPNGHQYLKSSDCPVCPICEKAKKPAVGFLSALAAPARRALEHAEIRTLKQLSRLTEKDLLRLHGIGPSSIPKLRKALQEEGLSFARDLRH